jgi:hypothetical protein
VTDLPPDARVLGAEQEMLAVEKVLILRIADIVVGLFMFVYGGFFLSVFNFALRDPFSIYKK